MIPGHRSRSKELEEFLNFVKGYEARQDNFYKSPLAENRWKRGRKQWRHQKWELQQQKKGFDQEKWWNIVVPYGVGIS